VTKPTKFLSVDDATKLVDYFFMIFESCFARGAIDLQQVKLRKDDIRRLLANTPHVTFDRLIPDGTLDLSAKQLERQPDPITPAIEERVEVHV
jgi:hypothetical protein